MKKVRQFLDIPARIIEYILYICNRILLIICPYGRQNKQNKGHAG